MAHSVAYDIFDLAKDLKEANVPEKAIDAYVKFQKSKCEVLLNNLTTKNELERPIAIVKRDIIICLGAINTALAGIIIAIMAYLK